MRRILIVDDDVHDRRALRERLVSHGHAVFVAADAVAAMRAATEEGPDVIVLGIELPGGSGLMVAERLLSDERTTDVPVIFVAACAQSGWRERAAELSAVAFLERPFEAVELLDALDLAMARRASTAALPLAA